MAYSLSEKAARLTPYEPIAGDYRVRLDANESFLPTAEEMLPDLQKALTGAALNRYPDPSAAGVCNAFARYYQIDPDCVTAGNGSDELISVVVNTFLQKGDTALVVSPDFSMYSFYLALAEAECVTLEKGDDFTLSADEVLSLLRQSRSRMLLFSNPCNPTGQGMNKEDVLRIVRGTDSLVVLDEAYMDFWDEGESLLGEAAQYDNLIVLRTCSKMMGLAGLRLGFAVAGETLTRVLRGAKSPYNVNVLTQLAGEAALSHPDTIRRGQRQILQAKEELVKALATLPLREGESFLPTKTNFAVLRTPRAGALFAALRERSIIVRCFPGFLRITVGSPQENAELIRALREIL